MQEAFYKFFPLIAAKLLDETGQDLVEYGLAITVIALGGVAGTSAIAQGISETCLSVGSVLSAAIT
jgi:Flp pilus assembly pilin Flp